MSATTKKEQGNTITASHNLLITEIEKMLDRFQLTNCDHSDLCQTIEDALGNLSERNSGIPDKEAVDGFLLKDALFIKEGEYFHKVSFSDILYFSSDHVYVKLHTEKRKFILRASLQQYLDKLASPMFFRTHRSHVVNLEKIEKINTTYVVVKNEQIPLSKSCREHLLSILNLA